MLLVEFLILWLLFTVIHAVLYAMDTLKSKGIKKNNIKFIFAFVIFCLKMSMRLSFENYSDKNIFIRFINGIAGYYPMTYSAANVIQKKIK